MDFCILYIWIWAFTPTLHAVCLFAQLFGLAAGYLCRESPFKCRRLHKKEQNITDYQHLCVASDLEFLRNAWLQQERNWLVDLEVKNVLKHCDRGDRPCSWASISRAAVRNWALFPWLWFDKENKLICKLQCSAELHAFPRFTIATWPSVLSRSLATCSYCILFCGCFSSCLCAC